MACVATKPAMRIDGPFEVLTPALHSGMAPTWPLWLPVPTLTMRRVTPGEMALSWTTATPRFSLQPTDRFSPSNWTNAPSGASNPATVPATLPTRFYRLTKP